MKNIHVLPTDKSSRISIKDSVLILHRLQYRKDTQYIYITNDEEIKEDYVISYGVVIKVMMFDKETLYFVNGTKAKREDCKKIILTTDQGLIKDGVQAIDDEFLEWFVKNPTCEYVELKGYAIILPGESCDCDNKCDTCKEEETKQDLEKEMFELEQELDIPSHLRWHNSKPKQETTLEEAAENEASIFYEKGTIEWNKYRQIFIEGAKWQQERMYSEEDMREAFEWGIAHVTFEDWLKRFKNK